MNYRQWVVDAIPCRRPHAERCNTLVTFEARPTILWTPSGLADPSGL